MNHTIETETLGRVFGHGHIVCAHIDADEAQVNVHLNFCIASVDEQNMVDSIRQIVQKYSI